MHIGAAFALVALVPALLGRGTTIPSWLVAVGTLVALSLFRPLRRRVQDRIDRRFNRPQYDAERTVETFVARLREQTDLETVEADLRRVVAETMHPTHMSVWIRR
jgi:membrane protein implicated in regulation of membrane protease activity